jgi:hypothetical protein
MAARVNWALQLLGGASRRLKKIANCKLINANCKLATRRMCHQAASISPYLQICNLHFAMINLQFFFTNEKRPGR